MRPCLNILFNQLKLLDRVWISVTNDFVIIAHSFSPFEMSAVGAALFNQFIIPFSVPIEYTKTMYLSVVFQYSRQLIQLLTIVIGVSVLLLCKPVDSNKPQANNF